MISEVDKRHEKLMPVLREVFEPNFEFVERIEYDSEGQCKKVTLILKWPKR